MKKRVFFVFLTLCLLIPQVAAREQPIGWVQFDTGYPALKTALQLDLDSHEKEPSLSWIELLALAATRHGGSDVSVREVQEAAKALQGSRSARELAGAQVNTYDYFYEVYHAVLGGLVGNFAVQVPKNGHSEWVPTYGLKAFSPIAAGYDFSHYSDFGNLRTFGFARRHLGNDLLGTLGTPIVAVEGGVVEAMGWNRYGGWRIGIRSDDRLRYYYYAHLRKDAPYAPGLREGDRVCAGQVIGFMGRTGYSDTENVNNIDLVHLHFGLELIFDEQQKEGDNELWINVYPLVELLNEHRSSVAQTADGWQRLYPFCDLDAESIPAN